VPRRRQLSVATPGGAAAPQPRAAQRSLGILAVWIAAVLLLTAPLASTGQSARVYFSDTDHPDRAIVDLIRSAHVRLEAAIYDLTDRRIAQALADAPRRHVDTWVVMDESEARRPGSQAPLLQRALGDHFALRTGRGGGRHAIMHHKFLVADDRVVATGSFNWTREAECCNWENLVILDDPGLARAFEEEFRRIWTTQQAR
jgi:phosphatidylserine/phosphatidylglycerophosphate/cardiolipin synthase-like enzyme